MKLSDFLRDIGRPVAYYPSLARVLGGVKEAIFLCQLIYWTGKQANKDGWIYKDMDELVDETGLSKKEQRTARRHLKEIQVLEENTVRIEHRIYYRINTERLNALWERHRNNELSSSDQPALPETPIGHFGKSPSGTSGSDQPALRYKEAEITSEITPETTAETSVPPPLRSGGRFAPLASFSSADGEQSTAEKIEFDHKPEDPVSTTRDENIAELLAYRKEKTGIESSELEAQAVRWLLSKGRSPEECKECFDYLIAKAPLVPVTWVRVMDEIGPWACRKALEATSREARQTAGRNRKGREKSAWFRKITCGHCDALLNPGEPECPACGKAVASYEDVSAEVSA